MSHSGDHKSVTATPKEHFQLLLMISILLFGYLLGVYGYYHAFEEFYGHANLTDCFYDALGLLEFKMEFHEHIPVPVVVVVACWIGAFALFWAGLKLIYSILQNYLRLAWVSFFYKQKTIVIFGATNVSNKLALDLLHKKEHKIIIVDNDETNHYLESLSAHGAIFIIGDPCDDNTIKKSLATSADKIICMFNDDSLNLKIYQKLNRGNTYIHISNRILYDSFAEIKNDAKIKKFFNLYSNAARQLFLENPLNKYVDTTLVGTQVRLAIVGDGILAKEVLFHAMNMNGFYNRSKLHITLVSDAIANAENHLLYTLDLDSTEIKKYFDIEFVSKDNFYKNNQSFSYTVIAEEDSNQALIDSVMCENKFKRVISTSQNKETIVIAAYSLDNNPKDVKEIKYNGSEVIIKSFGFSKTHFTEAVIIDATIDKIASYNNNMYNISHPDSDPTEFENLDPLSQDSNRALADHIVSIKHNEYLQLAKRNTKAKITKNDIHKLYGGNVSELTPIERIASYEDVCKTLAIEDINKFAIAEHARWNVFHITRGWRKQDLPSSFRKESTLKLHVCLVDWEDLDQVSTAFQRDYKIDDIEAIFRIPHLKEKNSQA